MNLHRLGRAAVFLAGSIIGGLALAFIIVFVHPQLLQRPAATATASATAGAPPSRWFSTRVSVDPAGKGDAFFIGQ